MYRIVPALFVALVAWGQALADTYAFSAPPGPDAGESRSLYAPLMDLLSRETGESFLYVHPESRLAYLRDMRAGRFQLLLDDAHFASWRITVQEHVPLVTTRESITFVAIATKDGRIYSREDLVGRPVCARAPPDLGTLGILEQFHGPFRVPQILPVPDHLDRVQSLLTGRCAGTVLARHQYTGSSEIRGVAARLKIIAQTDSYPGLTLTADPRLPERLRATVRNILLSRSGGAATRALRDRYAGGGNFVEANPDNYEGLHEMLRDYPGFER